MLYFGKFSMFLKGIHDMKPKGRRPFSRRTTDMAVTVWRTLDSNDRQAEGQSCDVLLSRGQLSGNQRPPVTGFLLYTLKSSFLKWTSAREGSFQLPRFSFAYLFKFHVPSCFSLSCQPFQTNTNKQKITSGCSWHIIAIHSGQIECFLCHDYFWVASLQLIVPPNIASIISQNQTPSVTQRLSDIRSCSAFALLSIWLQIPPKTLYHYPLCLYTIQQAPVINDDIYWYFHHSLKTLILHIFKVVLHVKWFSLFIHSPTACSQAVHHFSERIFHPSISIPTFCCQAAVFFKY